MSYCGHGKGIHKFRMDQIVWNQAEKTSNEINENIIYKEEVWSEQSLYGSMIT